MYPVMEPPNRSRMIDSPDREGLETQAAVRELLAILPPDVLGDIRSGEIDACDPAFLSGLMDHASRQSIADPQNGRRILGKIIRLRKLLNRSLRESEPGLAVSPTVVNENQRVGRNGACPCGTAPTTRIFGLTPGIVGVLGATPVTASA